MERREYQTAGSNDAAAASACRLRWLRSSSFHCACSLGCIHYFRRASFALRVLGHPHPTGQVLPRTLCTPGPPYPPITPRPNLLRPDSLVFVGFGQRSFPTLPRYGSQPRTRTRIYSLPKRPAEARSTRCDGATYPTDWSLLNWSLLNRSLLNLVLRS